MTQDFDQDITASWRRRAAGVLVLGAATAALGAGTASAAPTQADDQGTTQSADSADSAGSDAQGSQDTHEDQGSQGSQDSHDDQQGIGEETSDQQVPVSQGAAQQGSSSPLDALSAPLAGVLGSGLGSGLGGL